ncbi:hypothetical protein [Actinomadura madurae]|uniref:hypothetical protein n=1 Tax=Actinomadura madurae TaxID=1993 RepID=UPI0020D225F0|nr:hypothetical protein [Actinomadura madurae]MCP9947219.1 hypothetical protein [Actinomadura madurae]MCP9963984.1 hypothetical protein [Actinomadura madurae]MCP9976459.1 hypothetical protein [Actinomadura madurae]MCQ0012048.1 hypothetical protein [Actinomadura madurae]MCQ0012652.1 hypothetical protein [Actinomadura madurae]
MADDLRAQVMTAGHCTFCGEPAERGLSGAWWHLGQSCNVGAAVVPAGAVPAGPLGLAAQWPPRFKPGPYEGPRPDQLEGAQR